MEDISFWKKHKSFIGIGLLAAALAVTILIPAKIGIPSRSIDYYEQNDGQIACITLVSVEDDDTAFFRVEASPTDFDIEVEISLDASVEPGDRGFIADVDELKLDGSYEHEYSFYLPRNGNLCQKLLTLFGVWNFNLSRDGRILGLVDYSYTNSELGFSADFPVSPKNMADVLDGGIAVTQFKATTSTSLTYLECYDVSSLSSLLNGQTYDDWLSADQATKEDAFASEMRGLLEAFSGRWGLELDFDYSNRQGYPSAKTFVEVSDDARTDWYYAVSVVKGNRVYNIVGARSTEEKAKRAEASFVLAEDDGSNVPVEEAS